MRASSYESGVTHPLVYVRLLSPGACKKLKQRNGGGQNRESGVFGCTHMLNIESALIYWPLHYLPLPHIFPPKAINK